MKKNKGISLIVLIITIVVIIILATAIIVNIAQTNIIGNASEAVVKQDFKTFQEELDLYIADKYVDTKGEFDATTINAKTKDEIVAIIPSIKGSKYEEYVTIVNGKIVVSKEAPADIKEWGNEVIDLGTKTPVISVGIEVRNANSSVTGEDFSSTNPIIPVGFKAKETTEASWSDTDSDGVVDGWNNGLVIIDGSGNEFVWVPCTLDTNDTTQIQYKRRFEEYPKYTDITSVSDDAEALPMKDETTRISENYQISTYGGFYIGRYEAGIPENQTAIDGTYGDGSSSKSDEDGIPVVKKDATVWTNISYNKAMPNAKKLYENSTSVKSGLLSGTAWDTVCAWIHSETDSEKNIIHDVTNSMSWGNYQDSISPANVTGFGEKQVTGFSDNWRAKNIYDFAGNTYEWTGEIFSSYSVNRGGYYSNNGSTRPASYRRNGNPSNTVDYLSFRVMLYVM